MNAVLIPFPEARIMRQQHETPEQKTRRVVMARCLKADVPIAAARNAANSACQSVRAGFEPSACADRAVDRAIKGAFPDGPEAA